MNNIKSILLKSGITLSALLGGGYLLRLYNASKNIEILPNIILESVDIEYAHFSVDTVIKNPTKSSFKVKFPFVKVYYKDSLLGTSRVHNKWIDIPAFAETPIKKLKINFPLADSISITSDIIAARNGGKSVSLVVETLTYIKIAFFSFPFKSTETINL